MRTTHPNLTCQTPKYVQLSYVPGLSEKLLGILKPFNIEITLRNTNGFSHFLKSTKDPIFQNLILPMSSTISLALTA